MIMEAYDPFFESIRLNFGENSRVEQRWDKLFNNVGSLVKKHECIEDYTMGIYRLCFYLNNGRALSRTLLMNYYRYSNVEDLLVSWANNIEDEIRHEAQLINVTASWDIEQKWTTGPKWKHEWEAKWDSSIKEGKLMTNYEYEKMKAKMMPEIKEVIFNDPATIVKWADGTKTVVKVQKGEPYDEEKGLAMAFIKKVYANKGNYNDIFRKWCPKKEIPKVDDFNGTVEEMFEDDFECESCKINL